mmetsp:Transcript_111881/g.316097  ORF Transcript_111881/g.316097 Transcript_111881/m.316097 type:complete len:226 (+) Transcript_111881:685-1362(+)
MLIGNLSSAQGVFLPSGMAAGVPKTLKASANCCLRRLNSCRLTTRASATGLPSARIVLSPGAPCNLTSSSGGRPSSSKASSPPVSTGALKTRFSNISRRSAASAALMSPFRSAARRASTSARYMKANSGFRPPSTKHGAEDSSSVLSTSSTFLAPRGGSTKCVGKGLVGSSSPWQATALPADGLAASPLLSPLSACCLSSAWGSLPNASMRAHARRRRPRKMGFT